MLKNVNNKKCAPKLIFFNEKEMRKIPRIFDMGVKFWHFLTPPDYTNFENSINSFDYNDF